jgi:hypothetical protein
MWHRPKPKQLAEDADPILWDAAGGPQTADAHDGCYNRWHHQPGHDLVPRHGRSFPRANCAEVCRATPGQIQEIATTSLTTPRIWPEPIGATKPVTISATAIVFMAFASN